MFAPSSACVAQALTQKVMGDANYLVNPCVIMCPFAGPKCQQGRFRMNGNCKPSQLCTLSLPPHLMGPHLTRATSPQHDPSPCVPCRAAPRRLALADGAQGEQGGGAARGALAQGDQEQGDHAARPRHVRAVPDDGRCGPGLRLYEPLREASVTTCHFPHSFALGSSEHDAWLQATDEL